MHFTIEIGVNQAVGAFENPTNSLSALNAPKRLYKSSHQLLASEVISWWNSVLNWD